MLVGLGPCERGFAGGADRAPGRSARPGGPGAGRSRSRCLVAGGAGGRRQPSAAPRPPLRLPRARGDVGRGVAGGAGARAVRREADRRLPGGTGRGQRASGDAALSRPGDLAGTGADTGDRRFGAGRGRSVCGDTVRRAAPGDPAATRPGGVLGAGAGGRRLPAGCDAGGRFPARGRRGRDAGGRSPGWRGAGGHFRSGRDLGRRLPERRDLGGLRAGRGVGDHADRWRSVAGGERAES